MPNHRSQGCQGNGADQKDKNWICTCEGKTPGQNTGNKCSNKDGPFTFEQSTHDDLFLNIGLRNYTLASFNHLQSDPSSLVRLLA
jgi:hypothetical protein